MKKNNKDIPRHIVIFVEGDTDELFFKALVEHYKKVSQTPLLPCQVCNLKGVTRYSGKLLAKLKNGFLPEARKKNYRIQAVCCSYDTDVFELKHPSIVDWKQLEKNVRKLGIEHFVQIGVEHAIEDWILDDLQGICRFLKLKEMPKTPKGNNGFEKLTDLYAKANKTYQKGFATRELIANIDMGIIISKRKKALRILEQMLPITLPTD